MLHEYGILCMHSAKRAKHQARIRNDIAVITESNKLLPFPTDAGSADGKDAAMRRSRGSREHPLDHFRRVDCWGRIRHADDGCEPTRDSRGGARLDGFLLALPRLAQMHVRVDEAGRDEQPLGIDDPVGGR
jgi:hypothetical protein